MTRPARTIGAALALLSVCPSAAWAHPMPGVGDFYAGMLHPVMSIDFVLPLVALGLLAGQQPREAAIAMLVAIPSGLILGAIAALAAPMPPSAAWINLLWMPVLGGLIAWAPQVPRTAILAIALAPALTIGWANGTEIGDQVAALRFIPGIAVAGLLVTTYGAGGIRRLRAPWMQIAVRVIGSWIAAVGVLVLSLR
jgi:urease accessory protein